MKLRRFGKWVAVVTFAFPLPALMVFLITIICLYDPTWQLWQTIIGWPLTVGLACTGPIISRQFIREMREDDARLARRLAWLRGE